MSPRSPWLRLHDILDAIGEIRSFTAGMSREQFQQSIQTQRAVEMNLIIIGEAVAKMPPEWLAERSDIPWSDIRATRNIITHVYHGIDIQVVWTIATNHLDVVEAAIRDLATRHVPKDSPS